MYWTLPAMLLAGCGFLTEDDLTARMDLDGDGFAAEQFGGKDCDDGNRDIWPGAVEVCDGIDNNCDGDADGDALDKRSWYRDADGDGYGSPSSEDPAITCFPPEGFVGDASDCNDDPNNDGDAFHPRTTWYKDKDGDTYGDPEDTVVTCVQLPGLVADNTDCDDADPDLHPETVWWQDTDGDGFGSTKGETLACWLEEDVPAGFDRAGSTTADCDDANADVFPGSATAEDDPNLCAEDADGDGYGNATPESDDHSPGTDCDDTDTEIHPGAQELWHDQRLNDCTGVMNTVDWTDADASFSGNAIGDQLGKVVAEAGHFFSTSDAGLADLAIAAPSESTHGPSSGAVYILDTDHDDASFRASYLGGAQINRLGSHLANGGDLNEDGYSDLLIGTQDDYSYVIFGGETPASERTLTTNHKSSTLAVYIAEDDGDLLGAASAGLSNFTDGSYTVALALGAPMVSAMGDGSGRVYIAMEPQTTGTVNLRTVRSGGVEFSDFEDIPSDSEFTGTASLVPEFWTVEPETDGEGAGLGHSLANAGDTDGDGLDELVIGAPNADYGGSDAGAIYLVTGFDFHNDEGDDAPDPGGIPADPSGFTREIYGDDLVRVDGAVEGDHLGRVIAAAGDINRDGLSDVAIASTGTSSVPIPGRVYIWFGSLKGSSPAVDRVFKISDADVTIVPDDLTGAGNFGAALASPGDLDANGTSELLIGNPDADSPEYGAGRAYVIYGGLTGTWDIDDLIQTTAGGSLEDGTSRSSLNGALFIGDANQRLGTSVTGAGDLDGDRAIDLVLGAPGADLHGLGTASGAALLFNGASD